MYKSKYNKYLFNNNIIHNKDEEIAIKECNNIIYIIVKNYKKGNYDLSFIINKLKSSNLDIQVLNTIHKYYNGPICYPILFLKYIIDTLTIINENDYINNMNSKKLLNFFDNVINEYNKK